MIDYDFGIQQHHGIFRDVPRLSADVQPTVWSATAPSDMALESLGYTERIRIGNPSRTINGRHRYTISYALDDAAPRRQLAWNAVGTQWPVGIGNVEVHVVAPFQFQGARCVQGEAGSPQGGILLAESVTENHKVAWLIGAATDGYLDIEDDGGELRLLHRPRDDDSPVSSVLDTAFAGRTTLTLGSYNPSFALAWQRIGDQLAAWHQTCDLWDPAGDLHRKLAGARRRGRGRRPCHRRRGRRARLEVELGVAGAGGVGARCWLAPAWPRWSGRGSCGS